MSEITDLYRTAQRKYDAGKLLYESGFYNESIVHFYYSMYALAKILLLNKDITTKSHQGTINMIQFPTIKNKLSLIQDFGVYYGR